MITHLGEAIRGREFCYIAELVASGRKREAEVLEFASSIAMIPNVVACSVTSDAGDKPGQDPVRVGSAVRARGMLPNIHLTCAGHDRARHTQTLHALRALRMLNVFVLPGDWPPGDESQPASDMDPVQLIELIASIRETQNVPFHISASVSPFNYTREDCLDEYRQLEEKIAAGADLAITQAGWDVRKFAELKRYLDGRGLATPVFGNVHVLGRRAAEQMAASNPPGFWASPELLAQLQKESADPDGGLIASLERAAETVAVLKGLGFAGAYISGVHDSRHITRIIERAGELAPAWQEHYGHLQFGDLGGFYLDTEPGAHATTTERERRTT